MKKTFLSEAILPRAFIFGMLPHLVDLYQVYFQIMCMGPKMALSQGSHVYIGLYRGKQLFLSETTGLRATGQKDIYKQY